MVRKLLSILCSVAILFSVCAINIYADEAEGYLTVPSSQLPQGAAKINVVIIKPNATVNDAADLILALKDAAPQTANNVVFVVDEFPLGAETISYKMSSSDESGTYTIFLSYTKADGSRVNAVSYATFYTSAETANIISQLNSADVSEIYTKLYKDRYLYDIDFSDAGAYERLLNESAKSNLLTAMSRQTFTCADDVRQAFSECLAVYGVPVLNGTEAAFESNMNELLTPIFALLNHNIISELDQTAGLRRLFYDYLNKNTYTGTEDLKKAILEKSAIGIFKLVDIRGFKQYAEKFNDIYGFDFSKGYENLGSYKSEVFGKLQPEKSKVDSSYSLLSLREAFDDAVADVAEERKGGGLSGGGGNNKVVGYATSADLIGTETVMKPPVEIFKDVAEDFWGHAAILELYNMGVISGMGDRTFAPNQAITRAEFIKMLAAFFKIESSDAGEDFKDLPVSHWANPYITAAARLELVNGVSDDEFGINEPLTREMAATLLYRFLTYKEYQLKVGSIDFSDKADISDYAVEAVSKLYASKLMVGISETEFAPKQTLSRAMSAQLLYNVKTIK